MVTTHTELDKTTRIDGKYCE